jgi:undecaprenyl diphosphate synthase
MNAPRSIGILMDGNRRYARERGLPAVEGHRRGVRKIQEFVRWAAAAGVETIFLYGFSTENWKRAPEEVANLMGLFEHTFGGPDIEKIREAGFRVRVLGDRARLPAGLQRAIERAEAGTAAGAKGTLAVCLSYGGRAEIVAAANRLIAAGKAVDEDGFADALSTAGLPDPDLVIRTGGDRRLSNFLPWQSVYSELFFTETQWPALAREEFDAMLAGYAARERRLGR